MLSYDDDDDENDFTTPEARSFSRVSNIIYRGNFANSFFGVELLASHQNSVKFIFFLYLLVAKKRLYNPIVFTIKPWLSEKYGIILFQVEFEPGILMPTSELITTSQNHVFI